MILQNIAGNIKIKKQSAKFSTEADFHFGNKLYFGSIIIKRETGHILVPPEQHWLRGHNFLEMVLTKTSFNVMMI